MHINYNEEKLESMLRDFYNATGINIQFLDKNFRSYGYKLSHNKYCSAIKSAKKGICLESDIKLVEKCKKTKEPAMHVCHAGLIDIAVPVIYNSEIIGYVILGQMRRNDDFSGVSDYLIRLGLDCEVMRENYLSLQYYDSDRIQSVLNLANIITKYILLDHMLTPGFNKVVQRTVDFVDENLHRPISVEDIAKGVFVSKSTLYKNFKDVMGCTVGEYMTGKRMERAKSLLTETDISIQEVSQSVGFSSVAYFTANFKKATGITPSRYRKNNM